MADLSTQKQEVFDYVTAMLGGGMVDVELPNCTLSSKLAPVAIKKVAKMNPSDYKNEEQYKTAAIKIAMSVLQ